MFGSRTPSSSSTPKASDAQKETTVSTSSKKRAHVIVVGNEKGGCGKTTTSMHLIVSLMRLGFKMGSIDIDSRQKSLTRYVENRKNTMEKRGVPLPMPKHVVVTKSPYDSRDEVEADEKQRFYQAMGKILYSCDFVLIDSPGNDTYLSRLAHSFADTVITPINDSFVDLDVLANVDGNSMEIVKPSIYSEMIWEQKMKRAKRDGRAIEWVVMRNRLSNLDARNKRNMEKVTQALSRRLGFRLAPGFGERVIFRDMFLQGLTVLDVIDKGNSRSITMSHITARQEVRALLKMLKIPEVDAKIEEVKNSGKETNEPTRGKAPKKEPEVEAAEAKNDSNSSVTKEKFEKKSGDKKISNGISTAFRNPTISMPSNASSKANLQADKKALAELNG